MLSHAAAIAALLAAAAALMWLRRRWRAVADDPAALEARHGLPVLALLPAAPGAGFARLREGAPPPPVDGPCAEALRGLWLRLRLELQERGAHLVLVTGPAPGAGAVAFGLAAVAARDGWPVVLAGAGPGWPEAVPGLHLLPAGAGEAPDLAAFAAEAEAEGAVAIALCPDPGLLPDLPPAVALMVARQGETRITALRALRRALARRGLPGAGVVTDGYRTRRSRQPRG